MAQGLLPFHYAEETTGSGMTALAGLPLYLELAHAAGLLDSLRRHLRVAGEQGWDDVQVVLVMGMASSDRRSQTLLPAHRGGSGGGLWAAQAGCS